MTGRKAMDLDAFECPICLSLFLGSIFQCKNGHAVCDACRVRVHGTCPSCREPVGNIRCRPLENANAIAGMTFPCSFSSHGCTQLLKGTERRRHEEVLCQHAPLACPLHGCAYSGLLLYDHIRDAHPHDYKLSSSAGSWRLVWLGGFRVLLDPVDRRRVFLLLSGRDTRSGRSLLVVCICPPPPAANESLEYKMEVSFNHLSKYKLGVRGGDDEPGELSLSATGSVPCMRSWAGQCPTGDGFLFLPDAYCCLCLNYVIVKVHVQKSIDDQQCPEVDTNAGVV